MRKALHDFRPPAFLLLPHEQVTTDLPVEEHHLTVDGKTRPHLGGADALFEVGDERRVVTSDKFRCHKASVADGRLDLGGSLLSFGMAWTGFRIISRRRN